MSSNEVAQSTEKDPAGLAVWACRTSRGRVHREEEHRFRSAFTRDRDRVVHSGAFRRLEFKTQVFVYFEDDYYRTRLTHTIEVAQIARTLSRRLGLNDELAEAIALAHDLGHPPFGHAGETALDQFASECGGFNHNIQGLRICDVLERKYRNFAGLNLSWEVREGFAKHGSGRFHTPSEFAASGAQPSLEAQIVDLSDGIAYNAHDLDDGLAGGLLDWDAVRQIPVVDQLLQERGLAPIRDHDIQRAELIRALIDHFVTDALTGTRSALDAVGPDSVDAVRQHSTALAALTGQGEADLQQLRDFLRVELYRHPRVLRMTSKAARSLTAMAAALEREPGQLAPYWQERAQSEPLRRVIVDFLGSLTDKSAIEFHAQLFDPAVRIHRT